MEDKKKHSIKNYFLTGILVSTPLAITIYLAVELILFIDSKVSALIPLEYKPMLKHLHGIPGFGVLILFVGLIFVGWISSGYNVDITTIKFTTPYEGNAFIDFLIIMASIAILMGGILYINNSKRKKEDSN